MPNKLIQFWQELKRRKVTRVITVYAASAFVILELVDIIAEPLKLPEWFLTAVIIILCIGFIITVIVSWIYDIHTEGGLVKTESAHEVMTEDTPKSSNSWKIASYISFVVIVALIVLNVLPRNGQKKVSEVLDKSIAVLPFRNDSPDEEKMYFINGTMESILNNLCKIRDLSVVSRNSVEQYREHLKPTPVIAEEMNVSYVLEGSGHRDGNKVRLFIQLLDGRKDRHLWSKTYDADIEAIFDMQSEIAQLVASEIEAIITPEEKQRIEKVPTASLTAYDFYQRGREEYLRNWVDNRDNIALERAEELFLNALEIDSSFAQVYVGLARLFWAKQGFREYLSENYLDSILYLCDVALSYDDQLAEAYTLKGFYYSENGDGGQALMEFDKALIYNPNDWETYRWRGRVFSYNDLVSAISDYNKAVSLNHGPELPSLLRVLASEYSQAGFLDKLDFYSHEAFKLDNDSSAYYSNLAYKQQNLGNFNESAELLIRAYESDSSRIRTLIQIGLMYMYAGQNKDMLHYFEKFYAKMEASEAVNVENMHRLGYAYWMNGYREEAEYCFNTTISYYENLMKQERVTAGTYYDLAGVYAFRGEKEKAMEYLRELNQQEFFAHWWIDMFSRDPMFDSIRDESEFQQIFRDVEAKYQAEHERVRQWLEENDML